MLNSLDERLKARYGQDRWNPAGGQQQMTFQEWIDRHPALTRSKSYNEADARKKYESAVSEEGGRKWQAANPNWQNQQVESPTAFHEGGTHALDNTGKATPLEQTRRVNPAATPSGAPANQKRRFAMSYKDFVAKHGGKSTAALGAAYKKRAGQDLEQADVRALDEQQKMRQAALRRRGTGGQGGGGDGTTASTRRRRRPPGGGGGGGQTVTPI